MRKYACKRMAHFRPGAALRSAAAVPLVVLLSLVGVGRASGQTPSLATRARPGPARAAITAAYDQINAAGCRRDLDRVMSYLTPDYAEVDAQGVTWGRDQIQSQYQDLLSRVHTMQSRYVIQSLAATGHYALVEVRVHMDGTGEKRVLLARIQGLFTSDVVVRDAWVKTAMGWRLRHRQTLSSQTRMRPR